MLERITTIEPGFDFRKQQRRSPQFDKLFTHAGDSRTPGSDSADLSPAALCLQKMHWQLLKFRQNSPEKVTLHFVVDNIEFETDLDLAIQAAGRQRFLMNDYFFEDGRRLHCGTVYSLDQKRLMESAEYDLAPLQAVKTYFERAVSDSVHHDFPLSAIPEVGWYDGLYDRLTSELSNIYTGALAFVEKILQGSIHRIKADRQTNTVLELERFTIVEM